MNKKFYEAIDNGELPPLAPHPSDPYIVYHDGLVEHFLSKRDAENFRKELNLND